MKKLLYIIGALCYSAVIQADAVVDSNLALGAIFGTADKTHTFASPLAGIDRDVKDTTAQDKSTCPSGHAVHVRQHLYFGNEWECNFYISKGSGKIVDEGNRPGGYYLKKGGDLKGIYVNPFHKNKAYGKPFTLKQLDGTTVLRVEFPHNVVKCYKLRRIPPCKLDLGGNGLGLPTHFKKNAVDESKIFGLQEYFELEQNCPLETDEPER